MCIGVLVVCGASISLAGASDLEEHNEAQVGEATVALAAGDRVRATLLGPENVVLKGRFHSLESGVLTIYVDDIPVLAPLEEIHHLEVRTSKSHGDLVGAFVGLLVGGIVAGATQPDRGSKALEGWDYMDEDIGRAVAIVFAGAAVGAGVGSLLGSDQWQELGVQDLEQLGQTGMDCRVVWCLRF